MQVVLGLDQLEKETKYHSLLKGNVAYLAHSASVNRNLELGVFTLQKILGKRLTKLFGPQHGFVTDVQDNMVETKHTIHPYFKLKVYSLYSETRRPTEEMLTDIDTVVVDLQDVGTRVYTYIYTMTLMMEACGKKGIKVVVLDRPNPIGGELIEGNILKPEWTSFVGLYPLPMRHGLTLGEVALLAQKHFKVDCELDIVPMKNWKRSMGFEETGLPWVLPSPNLPTLEGAYTFPGTVLFEGTNVSEGRGTTRSLEIVGHPHIEAFSLHEKLKQKIAKEGLEGFILRPLTFLPTFQKHQGQPCGGFQIHVTDKKRFRPWQLGQFLMREFNRELGGSFKWKEPPYEYEYEKTPIDLINGTDEIRNWIENQGSLDELRKIEQQGQETFLHQREDILVPGYFWDS